MSTPDGRHAARTAPDTTTSGQAAAPGTTGHDTGGPVVPPPRRHGAPLPHDVEERRDDAVVVRAAGDADRHRGLDVHAVLGGVLAALGALVLLTGLAGALVGALESTVVGLVAGVVAVALACLVGGWFAGRAARHDGGRHGLLTALGLALLVALLAGLGALAGDRLDLVDRLGLDAWTRREDLGTAALVAGLVALVLAPLAAWLGGRLGERSAHRGSVASDVEVVSTRRGVRRHAGGLGTDARGTRTSSTTSTTEDAR